MPSNRNPKTNGGNEIIGEVDAAYEALDEQARQVDVPNAPTSPSVEQLRKAWNRAQPDPSRRGGASGGPQGAKNAAGSREARD